MIELENLKTYIKTHLKTKFVRFFKSGTCDCILFDQKLDKKLYLCICYQIYNTLIIKNWYIFLLIRISLNWLNMAKYFN